MFLSTSVCGMLSIKNTVISAYTPFVIYFVFHSLPRIRKEGIRMPLFILALAVVFILVKLVIGQDYFKTYLCFLGFPMMVAICLQYETWKNIACLRKLLFLFFIIECGLAVYEKSIGANVFPDRTDSMTAEQLMYYNPEDWEFRSGSLWGHPLANAMIVVVFMSFMVISKIKVQYVIPLITLGYISLYCFNARGSIIVASVLVMPMLVYRVHRSKYKYRKWIYLALALIAFCLLKVLMNTSFGGRMFMGDELMDGSAQTRLDVFRFVDFISLTDLLLGSPDLYLFVMNKLNAGGVENGVITLILAHGLIITIIILYNLFKFQYLSLKQAYSRFETFWLLAVFYIIGMMNPNLSAPVQWTFWILCYYGFRKVKIKIENSNGKENNVN